MNELDFNSIVITFLLGIITTLITTNFFQIINFLKINMRKISKTLLYIGTFASGLGSLYMGWFFIDTFVIRLYSGYIPPDVQQTFFAWLFVTGMATFGVFMFFTTGVIAFYGSVREMKKLLRNPKADNLNPYR